MSKPVVVVENLTKNFKIPLEASSGIKQKLINILKGRKGYRIFTPLKNISFTIEDGEFFGIVGRNGSGKSTLLKTIAQIYSPNEGGVTVNGMLVPFIELGVGFNPELSGRENVFLNGALLGFSHDEVSEMYSDIVEFAELGDFMEERLKNYSSGMQVRLAFSIAIRAHADILLLDEVLAVGDEEFQKKCYSYFDQLKREKKTVILVTHDMSAVERFCTKAILIDQGKIILEGKPHKVAAAYSRSNDASYSKSQVINGIPSSFEIALIDEQGKENNSFSYGENLTVKVNWKQKNVKNVGVAIFKDNGEYVFGPNTYQDSFKIGDNKELEYKVKLNLNEGGYFVKVGLTGEKDTDTIAFTEEGPHFRVNRDYDHGRWGGVTKLEYHWK